MMLRATLVISVAVVPTACFPQWQAASKFHLAAQFRPTLPARSFSVVEWTHLTDAATMNRVLRLWLRRVWAYGKSSNGPGLTRP